MAAPAKKPARPRPKRSSGSLDEIAPTTWKERVVDRSLGKATQRSLDRGNAMIKAATVLLDRSDGDGFTVQDVADEAGQSLRCFYQHFASKDDLLLAVLEEQMQHYADAIAKAVSAYDAPLDRLTAALFSAARLPKRVTSGVSVGLSKLHLKLAEVASDKVAVARAPVTALFRRLVHEAGDAGVIEPWDPDAAAYMLVALNATYLLNQNLGNEFGLRMPTVVEHVRFCLNGLHADLAKGWEKRFDTKPA